MDYLFSRNLDENEFNIGEAISRENIFSAGYTKDGDEETVSDDLESIRQEYMDDYESGIPIKFPGSDDSAPFSMKSVEEAVPSTSEKSKAATQQEGWADFDAFSSFD